MMTLLKIIHFFALLLGSAASLGNVFLMLSAGPHDLAMPGFVNRLRTKFRRVALMAIVLFWISGLLMVFSRHGLWPDSVAFNAKIGLVVVLSASVIFLNIMASFWARNGGPPRYVTVLHWLNACMLVLATVLAAIAFEV